jgi:hypothetical protein
MYGKYVFMLSEVISIHIPSPLAGEGVRGGRGALKLPSPSPERVCHSGLDPESRILSGGWIPACAGMTKQSGFDFK